MQSCTSWLCRIRCSYGIGSAFSPVTRLKCRQFGRRISKQREFFGFLMKLSCKRKQLGGLFELDMDFVGRPSRATSSNIPVPSATSSKIDTVLPLDRLGDSSMPYLSWDLALSLIAGPLKSCREYMISCLSSDINDFQKCHY